MDCPVCGAATSVINSRIRCDDVRRRRSCLGCGFRFSTIEIDIDVYKQMQPVDKVAIYKEITKAVEELKRAALCTLELDEKDVEVSC